MDSTPKGMESSLFTFTHELQLNLPSHSSVPATTEFTEEDLFEAQPQPLEEANNASPASPPEEGGHRPTTGRSGKVRSFLNTPRTL
jgi:hypothetical protein